MKEVRIAVIASGFTGQQHIEAVRRLPHTNVVALVDANPTMLAKKAKDLGVAHTFTDYKEMIEVIKPDVVHNCTPNHMHYEINKYVIEKGVHIYCEKPLATTAAECAELVRLAEEHGVACGVNYNYRNNAMVQEMRMRVKNNDIGRIFHITGSYQQDWLMYETDFNWRLASDKDGKSRAVADIGTHWFDMAQHITNKKIVKVYAKLFTALPTRKKPLTQTETFQTEQSAAYEEVSIRSEDGGFILVEFEDCTMGQLLVSQVAAGHKNDLRIEISGERYSMNWEQERADRLQIGKRSEGTTQLYACAASVHEEIERYATLPAGHAVAWSDAFRNGIGEYYASIHNGTFKETVQPYANFVDGYRSMQLAEACLLSNEEDRWVAVS